MNSSKFPLLALAAMLLAAPAAAQTDQGPTGGAVSGIVPELNFFSVSDDTLMVLVEYRPAAEIRDDLGRALGEQAIAEQRVLRTKLLLAQAEARIKIKEAEISSLKVQEDLAKNEQNEFKKKEFEARKRQAEREKQMLERRRDLRNREIGVVEALRDYYKAKAKVHELEGELGARRDQRNAVAGQPVSVAVQQQFIRLEQDIQDFERKTLEAQVDEANKWKDVANKETELVKARKSLFDSQMKVQKGR